MDTHRRRFILNYDQRDLCPAVTAAGARPLVLLSLPEGLYDRDWAAVAEAALRDARQGLPQDTELCAALPAGGFWMEPYGELPFAQVAAALGISEGSAKVLYCRAKDKLARQLEEMGELGG